MSEALSSSGASPDPAFHAAKRFFGSSVGAKVTMAVTGLVLWGFVTGHVLGNLLFFVGPSAINQYASALHHNALLLWGMRAALLLCLPLHIASAIRTSQLNRAARPVAYAYAQRQPKMVTPGAAYMLFTGVFLLGYFVFHIAHFTLHLTHPAHAVPLGDGIDVHRMIVLGFSQPLVSILYLAAMAALAPHLAHGIYSLFQHLGFAGDRLTPLIKWKARILGYGIPALFSTIPLAVMLGLVK